MTSPRYTDREVRFILKEAAEMQERQTSDLVGCDGMTLAELEQVASDVGIDPKHVRRAAARVDTTAHEGSAFAGATTRVILERTIDGELPESAHAEIVDAVRRETGSLGTVSIIGKTVTWGAKGTGTAWQVVVAPRDGQTSIRVENNITELAGVVQGIGIAMSIFGGMFGAGIAWDLVGTIPHAVAGAVAAIASVWVGGRLAFRAGERSARRDAMRLLEAVSQSVSSRVTPPDESP